MPSRLERNCENADRKAAGSGDSCSITGGSDAEVANKGASQMTLVCKASGDGRLGGCFTGSQKLPRYTYSALNEIGVRCGSDLASKCAQQVKAAHPSQLC